MEWWNKVCLLVSEEKRESMGRRKYFHVDLEEL
jgi:hypothetical protein